MKRASTPLHATNRETPQQWLSNTINRLDKSGFSIERFALETGSKRTNLRHVYNVRTDKEESVEDLKVRIERNARSYGNRYVRICAFLPDGLEPVDTYLFELNEFDSVEDSAGNAGLPDKILKQLHEHNGAMFDRMMQMQNATMAHLITQNERLEKDRSQMFEERATMQKLLLDIERASIDADSADKRQEAVIDVGKQLFRTIMLKVAGVSDDSHLSGTVAGFLTSLTREQQTTLATLLTNEQLAALQAIAEETVPGMKDSEDSPKEENSKGSKSDAS